MTANRIVVDGNTYEEGVRCKVTGTYFTYQSGIKSVERQFDKTEVVIDNCWDNSDDPLANDEYIVSDKDGYGWHPRDLEPISNTVKATGEIRAL